LVVDALSGPLAHYPEPRVRPVVVTDTMRQYAGGGAANTAGALARMGVPVGVFAKVGDDANGAWLQRALGEVGVDTSGIVVSSADSTPFTFVGIHSDGDRTFIHTPGANRTLHREDLQIDQLLAADFLLYQDCWALPELDGAPGAELLAEAQRRGVVTLLDECWGYGPDCKAFEAMLPYCDYVLPSIEDLRAIYPEASPEEMTVRLQDCGVGTVALKMGNAGSLLATGEHRIVVPALPAQVVDTTGAGDCWDAGFLAGLVNGVDLHTAGRLGAACAAYCITAVGGTTAVPRYDEVYALACHDIA
jgi:sugar/nucleoside kinase (ribokinase family)